MYTLYTPSYSAVLSHFLAGSTPQNILRAAIPFFFLLMFSFIYLLFFFIGSHTPLERRELMTGKNKAEEFSADHS